MTASHPISNSLFGVTSMRADPIFDQVAKTVSETLLVDVSGITPDTQIESLGATSLDFVTIAMDLEDIYGKEMFADEKQQFSTISEIVQHVRSQMENDG